MAQINKNSELVLGLITTVGTDTDVVISCINDALAQFGYTTEIVSVSKDIISQLQKISKLDSEYERISYFMDLGDKIREDAKDDAILMKGVSSFIFKKRDAHHSPRERVAYVIKSLKHPDEVQFLRDTYGDGFHLIGITSSKDTRMEYFTRRKSIPEDKALELLDRDANEKNGHGQHTQDAFQQSDYFININDSTSEIQASIERLMDLLFGNPFLSPTFSEYAMFKAYTTSLRSADLSRQIGVVITKGEEILAEGTNDCPKAHGGLYWAVKTPDFQYEDTKGGRDYTLGFDSNKIEQSKIIKNILENLGLEYNNENIAKVKSAGIGSLTEYGRVVHAEMESLMMCARNNISCQDSIMYATTFPCHNCAKHIIAAGISKVVYIEPYPKSKALEFYTNEITENENDKTKVAFIPFNGVGPHRFIDLFAVNSIRWYAKTRKNKEGKIIEWKRSEANLRNPIARVSYLESEVFADKAFNEEIIAFKKE